MLSREEILNASDIQIELVHVPEWGGDVYVRGMSGAERDQFEATVISVGVGSDRSVNLENIRAKLCAMTICDAEGKKYFSSSDIKDLSKKSAIALQRIFTVAQRLSGLTQTDIDELAEGLDKDPLEDSASD